MPGSWEGRDAGSASQQSRQKGGQWSELTATLTNLERFGERTRNDFSQEAIVQVNKEQLP